MFMEWPKSASTDFAGLIVSLRFHVFCVLTISSQLEKQTIVQMVQKLLTFCGTLYLITTFTTADYSSYSDPHESIPHNSHPKPLSSSFGLSFRLSLVLSRGIFPSGTVTNIIFSYPPLCYLNSLPQLSLFYRPSNSLYGNMHFTNALLCKANNALRPHNAYPMRNKTSLCSPIKCYTAMKKRILKRGFLVYWPINTRPLCARGFFRQSAVYPRGKCEVHSVFLDSAKLQHHGVKEGRMKNYKR
jgi:hypothetical protein